MKTYRILKKLSSKKIGDLSPLPHMDDAKQIYFEFYDQHILSMKNTENLQKNTQMLQDKVISKKRHSHVTRPTKRADCSEE